MDALTQFSRQGLHFDVRDQGPSDGPVVILLHGFPEDSSSWAAVAPRLHEQGLRTLAPDQRGYSADARPRAVRAYRQDELVEDVLALADAAGAERFHLVGHDWGGAVAWAVAIAAPGRVASLTVLATPHPAALRAAMVRSGQLLRSWYIGAFQMPGLPERFLAGRVGSVMRRAGLPEAEARRYDERFRTAADLRGPINWYRAAARSAGLMGRSRADQVVKVPTTYVWGNRDAALGRAAAQTSGRHVTGPYRFVELDSSHWLPEEQPEAVAAAILERVRSVSP